MCIVWYCCVYRRYTWWVVGVRTWQVMSSIITQQAGHDTCSLIVCLLDCDLPPLQPHNHTKSVIFSIPPGLVQAGPLHDLLSASWLLSLSVGKHNTHTVHWWHCLSIIHLPLHHHSLIVKRVKDTNAAAVLAHNLLQILVYCIKLYFCLQLHHKINDSRYLCGWGCCYQVGLTLGKHLVIRQMSV